MTAGTHEDGDAQGGGGMDLGLLGENVGPTARLLRNILTSRIMTAFEAFGLRSGTFSTMALIAANPGCAQADIAREIAIDKSIVVAIVDDLERGGLAARKRSTEDRRRNTLVLTEKGQALMDELNGIAREVEAPLRDALSARELQTLVSLMRRAVDALAAAPPR